MVNLLLAGACLHLLRFSGILVLIALAGQGQLWQARHMLAACSCKE